MKPGAGPVKCDDRVRERGCVGTSRDRVELGTVRSHRLLERGREMLRSDGSERGKPEWAVPLTEEGISDGHGSSRELCLVAVAG